MEEFLVQRTQRELAIGGILCVVFGICVLAWPHLSLAVLVLLFGIFALIYGLIAIYRAIRERSENDLWWIVLLEGLLSLAFAGITFFHTGITLVFLLFFIGFWAISSGIVQLVVGVRAHTPGGTLLVAGSIISLLFGLYMIFHPEQSVIVASWIIASYVIVFGIFLLSGALFLKSQESAILQAQ